MIPKIIHFCWFGGKQIPKEYYKYISTWKRYCPDYKIICWTEKNYDVNKNNFMKKAYECKKWGFVPDYARLDIIYRYGGIYLDTDVEMLGNMDNFLQNKMFVGMEKGNMIALGLGFGAEKGHPFIKQLRDRYDKLNFICDNDEVKMQASPVLQTEMFKKKYNTNFKLDKNYYFDDCTIYSTQYFCPEDLYKKNLYITNNTYLWHHYSASWFSKRQKIALIIRRLLTKYLDEEFAIKISDKIKGK